MHYCHNLLRHTTLRATRHCMRAFQSFKNQHLLQSSVPKLWRMKLQPSHYSVQVQHAIREHFFLKFLEELASLRHLFFDIYLNYASRSKLFAILVNSTHSQPSFTHQSIMTTTPLTTILLPHHPPIPTLITIYTLFGPMIPGLRLIYPVIPALFVNIPRISSNP